MADGIHKVIIEHGRRICNHRTTGSSQGGGGTGILNQEDANHLIARTLFRQSIIGIEEDGTNYSAVVRASLPGLRSACDLLYPGHPS